MTIVSVSRKKICDAIAKEPTTTLDAGSWVDTRTYFSEPTVRSRDCTVCAVGAVMRNALLHPQQDAEQLDSAARASILGSPVYGSRGNLKRELKKGRYMAALSIFFEREFEERGISDIDHSRERMRLVKQLKADCIQFVQENFPLKLEIDIDGAKPAKDVKVIEWSDNE